MSPTSPASVRATIPHGHTARRLEWPLLPAPLRSVIQKHLGAPVVSAASASAGYTPGFASVLTCADGSRHFVEAASRKAQQPFADAYREEARTLRALPSGLPVPQLLWSYEDAMWTVLELEYVDATHPARPWQPEELDACLDALELVAGHLTPAPPALELVSFTDGFADCLEGWDHVRRVSPDLPHLEEAAVLAAGFATATTGDSVVHTDVGNHNLLLTGGRALVCDWSRPVVGAAWIDTVALLVSAHGDGLDADRLLARRVLTRGTAAEDVDAFLALVAGYLFERRDQPVPNSSPYLRAHQDWYAEAAWSWLVRRRGWQ